MCLYYFARLASGEVLEAEMADQTLTVAGGSPQKVGLSALRTFQSWINSCGATLIANSRVENSENTDQHPTPFLSIIIPSTAT